MTELLGVDELPDRAVVDLEAAFGEFGHEPAQGEVPLPAAPDQPVAMRACDLLRLVAADLARRDAAGRRHALQRSARHRPGSSHPATAASDSRRRLWLACLEAAASRRSSSVEKSALTVTAVAMARILPRHGISSTSRGKSPASQNGRPLV